MMSENEHYFRESAASGSSEGTKKVFAGQHRISRFLHKIHSLQTLHIFAGFCQLLLGFAVVITAVLGLIHPIWLSTILSITASITIMTGLYFCYSAIAKRGGNTLLHDAMRRIAERQN